MTNGDREGMISNPAFVGEFTVSQPTEKFTHFIEPIHCPLFLGKTSQSFLAILLSALEAQSCVEAIEHMLKLVLPLRYLS